ncbi:hypothetical protein H9L39_02780 [Fusarium oxysporum f. sp. albedinis]|nr:hypothetical protein H9L39_02780 [Fusarium oxysporum f. sp. albedinis]
MTGLDNSEAAPRKTDLSGAASRSHDNAVRYVGWLVRQPSSIGEGDHEIGLGTRGRQFMSLSTCWSECLYTEVSELRQDEKDEG